LCGLCRLGSTSPILGFVPEIQDWNKHIEKWNRVGSDRGYHYLGGTIWHTRIGHAVGEAMLVLMKNKK